MTIKPLYQILIMTATACCLAAITIVTVQIIKHMIDAVSAYASGVRIPLP